MLGKLLKNKAISFVLLKYVAFGIQLINSVLIAKFLGVYYFGLYGFLLLVLQYLSYTNFGVQYSYSVLCSDISTKAGDQRLRITGTSISLLLSICFFLFFVYFFFNSYDLFPKYRFGEYSLFVVLIATLQYFNVLFVNVFRLEGKIKTLNFYYILLPLAQLIPLLFFKGEILFFTLIYSIIISNLISLALFLFQMPAYLKKMPLFKFYKAGIIIKRGFFLLLYNFTFYGILLTAKSIVSGYFSVEEFGLFNFANSISSAVFLLLGSLNFLFYPKLINIISSKNNGRELVSFIEKIRRYYLTLTIIVVFISLLSFPILFYFLPQYSNAAICLQILLFSQLIINNSFGYSTLLVQKGKELHMTFSALISIGIIVIFSFIGIKYYNNINSVASSVFLGVLLYNLCIGYLGNKILHQYNSIFAFLKGMYTPTLFIPVLICFFLMFVSPYYFANIMITIILYLALNANQLKEIVQGGIKLITKNDIFSID